MKCLYLLPHTTPWHESVSRKCENCQCVPKCISILCFICIGINITEFYIVQILCKKKECDLSPSIIHFCFFLNSLSLSLYFHSVTVVRDFNNLWFVVRGAFESCGARLWSCWCLIRKGIQIYTHIHMGKKRRSRRYGKAHKIL
jgi:hypothetical protein